MHAGRLSVEGWLATQRYVGSYQSPESSETSHVGAGRTKPPLVMVIDDDRSIREALTMVFEDLGLDWVAASNGADALKKLRDESRLPDLIVLDLMMPIMNGWDFRAEQLANPAFARIPTLVLTAAPNVGPDNSDLRVSYSLRKPVDLDLLQKALEDLIPGWRPTA